MIAAADSGADILGLVVCEPLLFSVVGQMIVRRLRRRGVPTLRVDEPSFASVARLTEGSGRGVIAVVQKRRRTLDRIGPGELWLAVEGARSAGNLGTLMRTCLAVGAKGVIALGSLDLYDPGCVRATMGALAALEVARTTPRALVTLARRSNARVIGTSPRGSRDFRRASYRGATIIVVGCERKGMSPDLLAACDVLVRIPMVGTIDSLNLAVAGSLVLYEAFSQRAPPPSNHER